MKKNQLGRTDLKVSEICLGTMTWGQKNTESEGHAQMDYAHDAGINFFDTAELYAVPPSKDSQGKTEEIIGAWFEKTGKRSDIILASKIANAGLPWIRDGEGINGQSISKALDLNLKRLKTDYIDLYQLHWPDRPTYRFGNHDVDYRKSDYTAERDMIGKTLHALNEEVKAGRIRHYGLSNDTSWGMMQWVFESLKNDMPRPVSIQNEYSLLWRWFDKECAEVSIAEDIGLLAYSPLATGMLSGKYLDGARPDGTRWSNDSRKLHRDTDRAEHAVKAYIDIAQKHDDIDVCQMALAWCLSRPFMTSTIIGATTMEQLKTNIAAHELKLSDEVLSDIDKAYQHHAFPF